MLSLITTGCLALSSGLASSTRPSVVGVARARPRVRQPVLAAADDDTCVEEECSILGTASGTPQVAAPKIPQLTYSEESRQYRRTVYFHESWVKHRSTDRFFKNLASTIDSGVVRSLYSEITIVTSIAVLVVAANMLIAGYDDLSNVHQAAPLPISFIKDLSLPALPFTIAMPALSLLLVFRTNTAYSRWNEARTLWGGIVNTCRNLQRQSNVYFSEDARGQQLRDELANQVREAAPVRGCRWPARRWLLCCWLVLA